MLHPRQSNDHVKTFWRHLCKRGRLPFIMLTSFLGAIPS
jgi:hypothetical protein